MFGFDTLSGRLGAFAAVLALTLSAAPSAAAAQDVPSYAQPAYASTDETIHGRIRSVDGAFTLTVADDRGFIDNVELHQGTIINPTGLTLTSGMSVTIQGVNAGSTFDANEIDTPYTYDGPLPAPMYYGAGYWCPGFAYGYGPSFSLALVIGGGGYRPWYYEHRPFYGRPWNGHAYFGARVGYEPANRVRFEERRPAGAEHAAATRVPPAFAGRSFAGDGRVEPRSTYSQEVQTERFSSTSLERAGQARGETVRTGAPSGAGSRDVPGGYGRSAPIGGYGHTTPGGFSERSAPGGMGVPHGGARGGEFHGGSAPHGGGGRSR